MGIRGLWIELNVIAVWKFAWSVHVMENRCDGESMRRSVYAIECLRDGESMRWTGGDGVYPYCIENKCQRFTLLDAWFSEKLLIK
jgi:hypothetical protein